MSRFFRQAGDSDSDSSSESEEELMSSEDEAPKPATTAARPTGMSRFLKGAAGSDSSSSDSESEDEDSDDSDGEKAAKRKSRFLKEEGEGSDDSDEDDVKRVIKSAKDKRLDEMEATGKSIENALKINDWVAILNGISSSTKCSNSWR
jgi:translation initiation factor 3 subunit C